MFALNHCIFLLGECDPRPGMSWMGQIGFTGTTEQKEKAFHDIYTVNILG